jgi:hypothetical protein
MNESFTTPDDMKESFMTSAPALATEVVAAAG